MTTRRRSASADRGEEPCIFGHEFCGIVVVSAMALRIWRSATASRSNRWRPADAACLLARGNTTIAACWPFMDTTAGRRPAESPSSAARWPTGFPAGFTRPGRIDRADGDRVEHRRRCRVQAEQVVAVHGAGPIGIGVLLTLRRRGVRVIMIDPSVARRAGYAALGASTCSTRAIPTSSWRCATSPADEARTPPSTQRVSRPRFQRRTAGHGRGRQFVVVAIHSNRCNSPLEC